MEEKVLTFKIIGPGGQFITTTNAGQLMELIFGCDEGGAITESTLQEAGIELEEGEVITYTLQLEKRHTQAEIDALPDSDGDIH